MERGHKRRYTSSISSGKRMKHVKSPILPPHVPQPKNYRYIDMPQNHKRKMFICDDCGSAKKYLETVCWLREMGCADGSIFEGIRNLNWNGQSFPFVEVEVVTPENNKASFLIFKKILFVIAFLTRNGLFQFSECDIRIENAIVLHAYNGEYIKGGRKDPWSAVGPRAMIEAVNTLALQDLQIDEVDDHIRAAEIFYVHLCEAAKLYPIEHAVYKSLSHSVAGDYDIFQTYREEAEWLLGEGVVGDKEDVYNSVKIDGKVDILNNIDTPSYFEDLLKKHANLSKFWYAWALSKGKVIRVRNDDLNRFHLRSLKSIRCILAVLSSTNLDKILKDCKKNCIGASFTQKDYEEMESKVLELQNNNQVFVKEPKT